MISKIYFPKNIIFAKKTLCEVLTRCHRYVLIATHPIDWLALHLKVGSEIG